MKNFNQKPLAEQVRPQKLEDFFGQEALVSENSFLFQAIKRDRLPSLIFWGPPGSGKTTLAFIIAKQTGAEFFSLSAVNSGKKDLLKIILKAQENLKLNKKTILFIDEIHRWNKAQQDSLLPYVEKGVVILIGATTENPSFEVNSALLSRARVLILKRLKKENIEKILKRAVKEINAEKLFGKDVLKFIASMSNGDARTALNILEAGIGMSSGEAWSSISIKEKNNKNITRQISIEDIKKILQKSHLLYDKTGEEHYNIISALHKSIRGGDASAGLYWLARMVEGGEDPLYIARRLVRFASEDVGLADNHALVLANAVFDTCHKLGYPECNVHLAQLVIYLAKTKKSVLAYEGYSRAKKDVEEFGNLEVPLPIRNAPTKLMKNLGYGKNYKYTPREDSSGQQYLPDELRGRKYF